MAGSFMSFQIPATPASSNGAKSVPHHSRAAGLLKSGNMFPDFSKPAAREWWGTLFAPLLEAGVAGIWNDMNEPAIFDVPSGTMPLTVRHDNDGQPTDHREIHN